MGRFTDLGKEDENDEPTEEDMKEIEQMARDN